MERAKALQDDSNSQFEPVVGSVYEPSAPVGVGTRIVVGGKQLLLLS